MELDGKGRQTFLLNFINRQVMKKILLCGLLLLAGVTTRATEVTFTTDEGYFLGEIRVYQEGLGYAVNGSIPDAPTETLDLEPGTYYVRAQLVTQDDYVYLPTGGKTTFTVGNSPMTVNYSVADNYVNVRFSVTDENGRPLEGCSIDAQPTNMSDEYSMCGFNATTGADGTAEALAAPDVDFMGLNHIDHYTELEQTFTTTADGADVAFSYAGHRRVTFTCRGYYAPEDMPDYYSGTITLNDGDGYYLMYVNPAYDGTTATTYAVLPEGNYDYEAYADINADGDEAYLRDVLTVGGSNADITLDFANVQPVTFVFDETKGFTPGVTKLVDGKKLIISAGSEGLHLAPGPYLCTGSFYDENYEDQYHFNQPFTVADAPVTVEIDTDPAAYHSVTFDVTTPQGKMQSICYVDEDIMVADVENYATSSPDFSNGTYDYFAASVWMNGYSYGLPYMPGGTFTVDGADVTVPVDLTGHRFFKIYFTKDGSSYSFSSLFLTDSEGNDAVFGMGGWGGAGMGLKPGTYAIDGTTDDTYEPIHGTLVVPDDCPEELTVEMFDGTSGIGSIEATNGGISVVDGGLMVSCTGRATVDVYDTTGRRVMSCTAADGETIGTTGLPAGIYVARMQQDGTAQSVKFAVR